MWKRRNKVYILICSETTYVKVACMLVATDLEEDMRSFMDQNWS
jgi:hypothetical protein